MASSQDSTILDTTGRPGWSRIAKVKPYVVPAVLVGYGFLSFRNDLVRNTDNHLQQKISKNYHGFGTTVENKLQYAPIAAVYALNVMGIKGEHNFIDRSGIFLMSATIMGVSVDGLKRTTGRTRPSGQDNRSFPSGHTAIAFLGAEIMRQEYKEISPWYGYAGYTVAGTTGVLRLLNNDHWLSDVVAGAGIGIASAKIAYVVYPWAKKKVFKQKDPSFLILPAATGEKLGFTFVASL